MSLIFYKELDLSSFINPLDINIILDYIDNLSVGDTTAKAAVDIALHDLFGKLKNIPLYEYFNINKREDIYTSFTIGISDEESTKQKIAKASDYKFLKIKLGTENDRKIIEHHKFLN